MDQSLTDHEKSRQSLTIVSRELNTFHNCYVQTADGLHTLYVQHHIQSTKLSVGGPRHMDSKARIQSLAIDACLNPVVSSNP